MTVRSAHQSRLSKSFRALAGNTALNKGIMSPLLLTRYLQKRPENLVTSYIRWHSLVFKNNANVGLTTEDLTAHKTGKACYWLQDCFSHPSMWCMFKDSCCFRSLVPQRESRTALGDIKYNGQAESTMAEVLQNHIPRADSDGALIFSHSSYKVCKWEIIFKSWLHCRQILH